MSLLLTEQYTRKGSKSAAPQAFWHQGAFHGKKIFHRPEMEVRWHHWLNGPEYDQTPGDSEGQESPACCGPRSHKVSNTTWWLNNRRQSHYAKPGHFYTRMQSMYCACILNIQIIVYLHFNIQIFVHFKCFKYFKNTYLFQIFSYSCRF